MRIEPLGAGSARAWAALLDACGCACFCRWWHFGGTKNEWLARLAHAPEANREEALRDPPRGLVAMKDDACVGWMKLAPRASLPKLRAMGAYRALDLGTDDGVFSIGCLLVHRDHRRRGVARALVETAPRHVRAWAGRAIEAYPRSAAHDPLHDEEAWMGTARLFASCGFVVIAGEGQYPVMRREVSSEDARAAAPDTR